ncbi:MAG: phosphotransferase [Bacteroidota bacterium]
MELNLNLSPEHLEAYLRQHRLIDDTNTIEGLEKPGEGNMNVVVRANGSKGSLIIKQSKSYVNKYPQIAAPIQRIDIERRFYDLVKVVDRLKDFLPGILGYVEEDHLLVLEDLGEANDYTYLYDPDQTISEKELAATAQFLYRLHGHAFDAATADSFPSNLEMRKLNHEHIFIYPFLEQNGLDLDTITPGLKASAATYQANDELKQKALKLGDVYLDQGKQLLHGDYFFGSWLKTKSGFKVIDPEFCFFGPAEYDLGVMMAHLDMARQSYDIETLLDPHPLALDKTLVKHFRAVEILRRVMGLAQLPLSLTLEEKNELLGKSYDQLMAL